MKHISASAAGSLQVLSSVGRSVSKIASKAISEITTVKLFSSTGSKLIEQSNTTVDKVVEEKTPLEQRMQDRLEILKRFDSLAKPKPKGAALARLRKMKEARARKLEVTAIKREQINAKRAENFAKLQNLSCVADENVCKMAYKEAKALDKKYDPLLAVFK